MVNITLFAQIISKLDRKLFQQLVEDKQTDKHNKGFNSWTHLVSMLFCQFSKSQSVRDISNGLRSATGNLNHLGVQKAPSKSSISYQNERRDYTLFRDYYFKLYQYFGQHPGFKQTKFRIKSKILLLDSSTITLCLSLFDWAKYKTTKGAIKLHTLLDFDGNMPAYLNITEGKKADNKAAKDIPLSPGSVIVADRGYSDYALLQFWDSNGIKFVVRHMENLKFKVIRTLPIDLEKHPNLRKNEIIQLTGTYTAEKYVKYLRRVAVWSQEHQMEIELVSNQMTWKAETIGELYKSRWEIEIFFRDIKNCLYIKSFIGTSQNAVMIQIWTAMITILILKILKVLAKYQWYLSNLVSFIRLNIFVKIDLQFWLDNPFNAPDQPPESKTNYSQGVLF